MADEKTTKTKTKAKTTESKETKEDTPKEGVHPLEEEVPFVPVTSDVLALNERMGYPIDPESGVAQAEPKEGPEDTELIVARSTDKA